MAAAAAAADHLSAWCPCTYFSKSLPLGTYLRVKVRSRGDGGGEEEENEMMDGEVEGQEEIVMVEMVMVEEEKERKSKEAGRKGCVRVAMKCVVRGD
jgi:hypothetical protein